MASDTAAHQTCWGCEARREHERHTGHICDKNVAGLYEQPLSLFQWGRFVAASGRTLDWKIECDALSPYDWRCLAEIVVPRLPVVKEVVGVPTGGEPFAQAIRDVGFDQDAGAGRRLIVDDVWTTGSSVAKFMQPEDLVVVVFARNPGPPSKFAPVATHRRSARARTDPVNRTPDINQRTERTMTTEGFAGLPYDLQPTTATRTSAHVPTVPDNVRYESLPPSLPHATYQATAATDGQVHPNSRLRDVQRVLRGYAKSARAAAHDVGDPDSPRAAALRGKAGGYDEAADLIESLLRGGRVRRKWRLRRG